MPALVRNAKSEKRRVKPKKRVAKYPAIPSLFFAFRDRFRVFHNECIANLRAYLFFSQFQVFVPAKVFTYWDLNLYQSALPSIHL